MATRKTEEHRKKERDKNNAFIAEVKSIPCRDCGNSYPLCVMEFDHRDPSQKKMNIGNNRHMGFLKLQEEIAKCDIVCANCHRIRHMKEKQAPIA